eukprot:scaffold39422_cov37-Tisochrysis_lutea.AAC.3
MIRWRAIGAAPAASLLEPLPAATASDWRGRGMGGQAKMAHRGHRTTLAWRRGVIDEQRH